MKLYLIRHGESENNLAGLWTGWMDVALTEKGHEDAQKARAILQHVTFDRVYCSDLHRAKQTAQIALPEYSAEATPLLREINVGSLQGKPFAALTAEARARVPQLGYSEFGGETHEEFQNRITTFLHQMEDSGCENVAAFAHGGWLRGAFRHVLGVQPQNDTLCCRNCTVAILEFSADRWKLHSWINLF